MTFRIPRRSAALLVALAAIGAIAILSPGYAGAQAAASSIASATVFPLGTPVAGGGLPILQYWRLNVYGGDRLTLDSSVPAASTPCGGGEPVVEIYEPGVTDFQIASAKAVVKLGFATGDNEQMWTSPFTGMGVMQLSTGGYCTGAAIPTFSLTITDDHETAIRLVAPTLAKRGTTVTVTGTVSSDAGTPTGNCLINGGSPVPITSGRCVAQVRATTAGHQVVRVEYVPDDGWQAATAKRSIRVYQ